MEINLILEFSINTKYLNIKCIEQFPEPNIINYQTLFNLNLYKEILEELNYLNYHKNFSLEKIKKLGSRIYNLLFSNLINQKPKIFKKGQFIFVFFEDSLDQIPIEISYNDYEFLGISCYIIRRFSYNSKINFSNKVIKSIMIIANPANNSISAYKEGKAIFNLLIKNLNSKKIDFISHNINKMDYLNILESYDWLHFAGHGIYPLNKTVQIEIGENQFFDRNDLLALKKVPDFIFLNACQSAKNENYSDSLISKFIQLNAKTIIATQYIIPDKFFHEKEIMLFYSSLLENKTVSQALKDLQKNNCDKKNIKWIYYHLYGSPYLKLVSVASLS